MNQADLKPAQSFALNFGVKSVVYGKPGSGKTPICCDTAPRPVLMICEPGMLSMRKSTVPTWPAFNSARVDEFMLWLASPESKNFDTVIIDSVSQMAEKNVEEGLGGTSKGGNEAHGLKVYGAMSRWMMKLLNQLYFMPQKHVILIAKMQAFEQNGMIYSRPYFPGRELPVRVPHLFDEVLCLGDYSIPGVVPAPTKAFRCKESFDMMARDRSGNLAEYEPPDITKLIAKCVA